MADGTRGPVTTTGPHGARRGPERIPRTAPCGAHNDRFDGVRFACTLRRGHPPVFLDGASRSWHHAHDLSSKRMPSGKLRMGWLMLDSSGAGTEVVTREGLLRLPVGSCDTPGILQLLT